MILGFLIGIQLARGLGAEGYGVYGVAVSIIALLKVPTEFGLPTLITREVSIAHLQSEWGRIRGIVNWATRICLITSATILAAVIVGSAIVGNYHSTPVSTTLVVGSALIPLVALTSLRCAAVRGMGQTVRGQIPDVLLNPLIFSGLLLLLNIWKRDLTPEVAIGLSALSAATGCLVAYGMFRKATPKEYRTFEPQYDTSTWWYSVLPMALTEGMRIAQGQISILITAAMLPIADVGVYRVAASIATILSMPITLFNLVGAPFIARLYAADDKSRLQRMLGYLALGMTAGTVVLIAPLAAIGEFAILHLFGEDFVRANNAILILGSGLAIGSCFGSSIWLLNMAGLQRKVTRASLTSLLLLIALTPPMTLYGGISGAAFATSISYVVWNYLMWRSGIKGVQIDASLLALFK